MTFEEMEHGLKGVQDNMTAQGVMMYRVENNMDRVEADVAHLASATAIGHLAGATTANSKVITRLEEIVARLTNDLNVMQAAMKALFERMDRFIRGLESDGREGKK